MAETILGKTVEGKLIVKVTKAGPSSYATATKPTMTVASLSKIEEVLSMPVKSGYVPEVSSKAGNVLTYKVLSGDYDPAAVGPLTEVIDTTDLDAITFEAFVIGY